MSTLEEVKAATARLKPEKQVELFRWWTSSEIFRARQLSGLKRELAAGLSELDHGLYRAYSDANVMQLADEVSESGRKKLERRRNEPPT
jgi:hypothetical protein